MAPFEGQIVMNEFGGYSYSPEFNSTTMAQFSGWNLDNKCDLFGDCCYCLEEMWFLWFGDFISLAFSDIDLISIKDIFFMFRIESEKVSVLARYLAICKTKITIYWVMFCVE